MVNDKHDVIWCQCVFDTCLHALQVSNVCTAWKVGSGEDGKWKVSRV